MQTHLGVNSLYLVIRLLSLLLLIQSEVVRKCPAFRQARGGTELFLHQLILSCLQLKIIFMPKCHILGVAYSDPLQYKTKSLIIRWLAKLLWCNPSYFIFQWWGKWDSNWGRGVEAEVESGLEGGADAGSAH